MDSTPSPKEPSFEPKVHPQVQAALVAAVAAVIVAIITAKVTLLVASKTTDAKKAALDQEIDNYAMN